MIKGKSVFSKKKSQQFVRKIKSLIGQDLLGFVYIKPYEDKDINQSADKEIPSNEDKMGEPNTLIVLNEQEFKDPIVVTGITDKQENLKNEIKSIFNHSDYIPVIYYLRELWVACFESKYDWLDSLSKGFIIYDKGILQALVQSWEHQKRILSKFDKYVVAYSISGSRVLGKAKKGSDVDVVIVIDDTDIKKMTRQELLDRLRSMAIRMAIETGQFTGIDTRLNVQLYLLTRFWQDLTNGNPIIYTLLRDGIPLYDRGVFTAWKILLSEKRILTSDENLSQLIESGQYLLDQVSTKINDMIMEDLYYAMLSPSQAALIMLGHPPPTPTETFLLVRTETENGNLKYLSKKHIIWLEEFYRIRKSLEHHERKSISADEFFKLYEEAKEYIERLLKSIQEIETLATKNRIRDVLTECIFIWCSNRGLSKMSPPKVLSFIEEKKLSVPSSIDNDIDIELARCIKIATNLKNLRSISKLKTFRAQLISLLHRLQTIVPLNGRH